MPLVTTRAYALALQLTEPSGFWVSAGHGQHGHGFARRIPALRADTVCPPAAVSGNPRSVTAPVGPLQPGGTSPLSTFEKAQSMADLWMPAAVREQASADRMDALCMASHHRRGRDFDALNVARCAVKRQLRDTVYCIRDRGCLLHVNAPAFGGAK